MQISDEEVRQFAALWEREFHECLSLDDARIEAGRLLELYSLLAEPLKEINTNPT